MKSLSISASIPPSRLTSKMKAFSHWLIILVMIIKYIFELFRNPLGVNHQSTLQVGSMPRPLIASTGVRFRNFFVNFGGYDMSRGVEMNDFMLLDLSFASSEEATQHRPKTDSVGSSIFRSANAFASACRYADEEEEEDEDSLEEDSEVEILHNKLIVRFIPEIRWMRR